MDASKPPQVVGGANTQQAFQDLAVDVPVRAWTISSNAVTENEAAATVGTLQIATGPATTFSVVGTSKFEVADVLGTPTLKLKAGDANKLDHEAGDSVSVPLQASVNGMTVTKSFAVTVVDANDPATDVAFTAVAYNENVSGTNARIGTLTIVDQDRA